MISGLLRKFKVKREIKRKLKGLGIEKIKIPSSLMNRVLGLQNSQGNYDYSLSETHSEGSFVVGERLPSYLEQLKRNYERELEQWEGGLEVAAYRSSHNPGEDYAYSDHLHSKPETPEELKKRVPVYATVREF